jgi:uncharacterized repeat protein (TIGR03806 family)
MVLALSSACAADVAQEQQAPLAPPMPGEVAAPPATEPLAQPSASMAQPTAAPAASALGIMQDCTAPASGDAVPDSLAQTGCFDAAGEPSARLIAFEVNAPLWTDGAHKQRWFALPDDARISIDVTGDFELPVGSVLAKTISMDGRRIETRLLMHHTDGEWSGYAYEWASDQRGAYLVPEGDFLPEVGEDGHGWEIPSSRDCTTCHSATRGFSLGLEVAQLDREVTEPMTGAPVNQLAMFEAMGVLEQPPKPALAVAPLTDWQDEAAPLDDRARSYLHANCSSCHTDPEGFCTGDLAARPALAAMGICNAQPTDPSTDWDAAMKLLVPGSPERSVISHRMHAEPGSALAMPPIGRKRLHAEGIALIDAWIASIDSCDE